MLKRSSIILATIAVFSFTGIQAQLSNFAGDNCTGYYFTDINAAFLECFDTAGDLVGGVERFYSIPLDKECNSTNYDDFLISLNHSGTVLVPSNLTVDYCDYFEVGTGYQFT